MTQNRGAGANRRAGDGKTRWSYAAPMILTGLAIVLIVSQVKLALVAGSITHATATRIETVAPILIFCMVPAAAGLAVIPLLGRVSFGRRSFAIMIATGLAMRLVWLGNAPPIEDDFNRYLLDGAVVVAGYDPYVLTPERVATSPPAHLGALSIVGRDVIARVNFPELTSIYPGTAQLAFAVAHILAPWRVDGLRIVFIVADIIALLLLMQCLARMGRPGMLAALYWCHPLVVLTTTATVHVDALLPPMILGAILAARLGRPSLTAALLAAAVGVKLWPVLLLPLFFRYVCVDQFGATQRRATVASEACGLAGKGQTRDWLVSLAVFLGTAGMLIAPVLMSVARPDSGLAAYSNDWVSNNAIFAWAEDIAETLADGYVDIDVARWLRFASAAGAACTALLVASRLRRSGGSSSALAQLIAGSLTISTTTFYLSPAQFPWYSLWFLPFAAALTCRPLLTASMLLPAYYLSFPLADRGQEDLFAFGIAWLHALPVIGWFALRGFGRDATATVMNAR